MILDWIYNILSQRTLKKKQECIRLNWEIAQLQKKIADKKAQESQG